MPIRIQLAEVVETLEVEGARFHFVRANAGHVEDAAAAAGQKGIGSVEWNRRYNGALWGAVLRGWDGIEDTAGRPVPFEPPAEFRDKVRAEAVEAGEREIAEDTITERARQAWVLAVVRALPAAARRKLNVAVEGDRVKAEAALGN